MSIKNTIRERTINTYVYFRSELISRPRENEERFKEKLERENSPEYKQDLLRRSSLKALDKANEALVAARIKNTIQFFNDTLTLFIKKVNVFCRKNS